MAIHKDFYRIYGYQFREEKYLLNNSLDMETILQLEKDNFTWLLDWIKVEKDRIKDAVYPGIYLIYDNESDEAIYIGLSNNIAQRLKSHHVYKKK